jgi:small conductance mechanosensitive channel
MDDEKITQILRDFKDIDVTEILFIIAVAFLITKAVDIIFPWLAERLTGRLRLYILPTASVLRLIILFIAIVTILPMIVKFTVQNSLALIGAAGVAIGFALKDYASSIVGGIVAMFERPFRAGDWVQINGAYGEVQSVKLRAFKMVTPDDTTVTVPNLKIWQTNVFNSNDGRRDLMCVTNFYLEPCHDAILVRQTLHDVGLSSPYLNLERPIIIIVAEKPWGTHYKLKAYPVDARDQFQFISDLTIRGKSVLRELKIQSTLAVPAVVAEELEQTRSSSGSGRGGNSGLVV